MVFSSSFNGQKETDASIVNSFHLSSDVDKSAISQHHTLGILGTQASPGDHTHDGTSSKKTQLKNLEGQSIVFTVENGTTETQPTFSGAPLFTGSYTRFGNMCHFQIDVDMDNITGFGTGGYYVDLPFYASHSYKFSDGCLHDTSTERNYSISGRVAIAQKRLFLFTTDAEGNRIFDAAFTHTVPVTLTVADNFYIAGTYEIGQP